MKYIPSFKAYVCVLYSASLVESEVCNLRHLRSLVPVGGGLRHFAQQMRLSGSLLCEARGRGAASSRGIVT